jgi:hypothetical protein
MKLKKKLIFFKKNQSQLVLILKTCDHGQEAEIDCIKGKHKKK